MVQDPLRVLSFAGLVAVAACSSPTGPSATPPVAGVPDQVNCSAFGNSRDSAYVLPFPIGQRVRVNRTFEHHTPLNGGVGLYAIDFDLPMRSPVHAARAGVVAAVEERFSDDDKADFHENWVMIRHADGSIGRYIHLTRDGAFVDVGDRVAQGQPIGLTGNSGPSSGPHLHFDVQTCGPNLPPAYNQPPCGMTLPVSFRNTESHACGLVRGSSYIAEPFSPEDR